MWAFLAIFLTRTLDLSIHDLLRAENQDQKMRRMEKARTTKSLIFTLLATVWTGTIPMSAGGMEVHFPDDELEQAIRIALSIPAERGVMTGDLIHLKDLDAGSAARGSTSPIRSLEGLQYAHQLSSLSFEGILTHSDGNPITIPSIILDDTSILNNLPKLKSLNISRNSLNFFDFSHGFPSLSKLNVSYNFIDEISILSNLQKLEILSMDGNPIRGAISLKYFPGLVRFTGYGIQSPLEDVPSTIVEIGFDARLSNAGNELESGERPDLSLRMTMRKQSNPSAAPVRLNANKPTIRTIPGLKVSRDVTQSTMIVIQCNGAQTPSSYDLKLSADLHSWSQIGYIIFNEPTDSFHIRIEESDHDKIFFMNLVQSQ